MADPLTTALAAFAGAMLSTGVIFALSRFREMTPEAIVLLGVALSALFTGGTALVQYFAEDSQVAAVVFWTFGDLGRVTRAQLLAMGLVLESLAAAQRREAVHLARLAQRGVHRLHERQGVGHERASWEEEALACGLGGPGRQLHRARRLVERDGRAGERIVEGAFIHAFSLPLPKLLPS